MPTIRENPNIEFNYTFTISTDKINAKMLCEVEGMRENKYRHFFNRDGKLQVKYRDRIAQIHRDYEGKYKDQIRVKRVHNLVPSVLRDSLATLISGTTVTPTFKANYMALGSDSTVATNADTTLGTETIRGTFSERSAISNVAYLDKFWSTAQVGGNTYLEAGIFVDGTASVDTGFLLSRVVINEAMGVNETLTINATITIN